MICTKYFKKNDFRYLIFLEKNSEIYEIQLGDGTINEDIERLKFYQGKYE